VAWLSAQPHDDPVRLVHALALAVRTGAGRPSFGQTLLAAAQPAAVEGITAWLAEVAHTALDIVLIVDEAERLPPESIEALAYLLRNAPANLRVVIAARADCHLGIDDLVDYDQCLVVGPTQLRFDLGETISLVRSRLGAAVDDDAAARLHELAEGWPLGLQLALTVMSAGADPRADIGALSAAAAACASSSSACCSRTWRWTTSTFLTRISFVDDLHPDCAEPRRPQPTPASASPASPATLRSSSRRGRRVAAHARAGTTSAAPAIRRTATRRAGRAARSRRTRLARPGPARGGGEPSPWRRAGRDLPTSWPSAASTTR
jgi:hypothetical protein